VLVEEIDAVGAQTPQRAFDGLPDVRGFAVEAGPLLAGLQVDIEAELGGDDDLLAERSRRLTQDALGLLSPSEGLRLWVSRAGP
jgi:hypothetical protein